MCSEKSAPPNGSQAPSVGVTSKDSAASQTSKITVPARRPSKKGRFQGNVTGEGAEFLAERYFSDRGYAVLARNFSVRGGEIDLVVTRDAVVAFVEVKFRHGTQFGDPSEAVTLAKQRKISLAALEFDSIHGLSQRGFGLRFDVLAITNSGGKITFTHLENAFESACRPFSLRQ